MYLGETYHRYIKTNGLKIYNEKNVEIPKPELYVVFTGERDEKPETISLRKCFFNGEDCCVDVEAKVIYDSRKGDIINQYITFSKVFDEQYRLYPGDRTKAVQETIRICLERDVLKEYLEREEAAAVMFTFADQVEAMNEALSTERAEGEKMGEKKGEKKGESKLADLITKLFASGRGDEVERAAKDENFRTGLFKEFHIL